MLKSEFTRYATLYGLEHFGVAILGGHAKLDDLVGKLNCMVLEGREKEAAYGFRLMVMRAHNEHPATFRNNRPLFDEALESVVDHEIRRQLKRSLYNYSPDHEADYAGANRAFLDATMSQRHGKTGVTDTLKELFAKVRLAGFNAFGPRPTLTQTHITPPQEDPSPIVI
jgi:hypothetical protein